MVQHSEQTLWITGDDIWINQWAWNDPDIGEWCTLGGYVKQSCVCISQDYILIFSLDMENLATSKCSKSFGHTLKSMKAQKSELPIMHRSHDAQFQRAVWIPQIYKTFTNIPSCKKFQRYANLISFSSGVYSTIAAHVCTLTLVKQPSLWSSVNESAKIDPNPHGRNGCGGWSGTFA